MISSVLSGSFALSISIGILDFSNAFAPMFDFGELLFDAVMWLWFTCNIDTDFDCLGDVKCCFGGMVTKYMFSQKWYIYTNTTPPPPNHYISFLTSSRRVRERERLIGVVVVVVWHKQNDGTTQFSVLRSLSTGNLKTMEEAIGTRDIWI